MSPSYSKEIEKALTAYDKGIETPEIITPLIAAIQAGNRPPQYIVESGSWSGSGAWLRSQSLSQSRSRSWALSWSWSRSGSRSRLWLWSLSRSGSRSGATR